MEPNAKRIKNKNEAIAFGAIVCDYINIKLSSRYGNYIKMHQQ